MAKKRFKVCVNVYLCLEQDDKILLYLRENTGYADGFYSLVAGHIDGDEPASLAMVREAQEEIGITIDPKNLYVVHTMHRITDRENIDIFFSCKKWTGEIQNIESHKCGELIFVEKNKLPQNTLAYIKCAIENAHNKKIFSEIGW